MATIFTDNFNSYSDGDLNGQGSWTKVSGLVSVQGTTVKEGAKGVSVSGVAQYKKTGTSLNDGRLTVYVKSTGTGPAKSQRQLDFFESGTFKFCLGLDVYNSADWGYYSSGWHMLGYYTANAWCCWEVEWRSSDHKVRYRLDGGTWTSWVSPVGSWTSGIDGFAIENIGTETAYWDYIAENPIGYTTQCIIC
jgi:hypothetical protein